MMHLPLYEGEVPRALLVEGATLAPTVATRFAIREGGKTVGAGVVTEIVG
jgi:translation elongation factor EF-Tu-like GTPase